MLSNIQIEKLINKNKIRISPFSAQKLDINHYHIFPYSVSYAKMDDDGIIKPGHVDLKDNPYVIDPNEYIVVTIEEKIILENGIFGEFYPASQLIEDRLILNCGRLNSQYKPFLRFGIFNASPSPFVLFANYEIARISFYQFDRNIPVDYNRPVSNKIYNNKINKIRENEEEIKKLWKEIGSKNKKR